MHNLEEVIGRTQVITIMEINVVKVNKLTFISWGYVLIMKIIIIMVIITIINIIIILKETIIVNDLDMIYRLGFLFMVLSALQFKLEILDLVILIITKFILDLYLVKISHPLIINIIWKHY